MLHTSFFKQEKHLDYILHYLLIIESTSKAPYYKVKSKGFSKSKIGIICGLPLIFDKISEGQYHYIQRINKTVYTNYCCFLCMHRDVSCFLPLPKMLLRFSLHAQRCFPRRNLPALLEEVFSACAEIFPMKERHMH